MLHSSAFMHPQNAHHQFSVTFRHRVNQDEFSSKPHQSTTRPRYAKVQQHLKLKLYANLMKFCNYFSIYQNLPEPGLSSKKPLSKIWNWLNIGFRACEKWLETKQRQLWPSFWELSLGSYRIAKSPKSICTLLYPYNPYNTGGDCEPHLVVFHCSSSFLGILGEGRRGWKG